MVTAVHDESSYFSAFVLYGTAGQVADVIERFLAGTGLYPQEFNDFIDCSLSDPSWMPIDRDARYCTASLRRASRIVEVD